MKTFRKHTIRLPLLAVLTPVLLALSAPTYAADFAVTSTADAPDANPGDGKCADSQNRCTLRAAIMEANATTGDDNISLSAINDPNNPITLTIAGADETTEHLTGPTPYQVVTSHDASKGDLNITDSVNISGAGSANTIIQWSPSVKSDPATGDRVFHVEAVATNVTVNISGLTIRNGVVPNPVTLETLTDGSYYQFKRSGAGIAIGPAATIDLINPSAAHGGGGDEGGPPTGGDEGETSATVTAVTLTDVNVVDNQSGGDGGGIYNTAPLTIDGAVISGNTTVGNGGGIYNDGDMAVTNTTIGTKTGFSNANTAEGGAGLFDTGLHTTTINASTIAGNQATGGGGISARSLVVEDIVNSTLSGNSATDVGGAITTNGTVNLQNVTLADNSAASDATGGGAALNSFGNGTYNFVNTLFSNNQKTSTVVSCGCSGGAAACPAGRMVSGGHNIADDSTCFLNGAGDLANNTNILLQALGDNGGPTETRAIPGADNRPVSAAIDAGDNSNCPNNDQRGSIRPADGDLNNTLICDIGAFERFISTADLHINSVTAPDSLFSGEALKMSVQVHNGNASSSTAAVNVSVTTDALPAALTNPSATIAIPASGGGTTTNPCTISSGVVTCSVGPMDPDALATMTLSGTAAAPGKLTVTTHVQDNGPGAPPDTYPANNTATANVNVVGNSDLSVTASGTTSPVDIGADTTLDFNVENKGPDPANNVRFAVFLPNTVAYKAITPSTGSCTLQSDNVSILCTVGALAANASITGTLDVTAKSEGNADVTFQATADERDADNANDTAAVGLSVSTPQAGGTSSGGCAMRPGGSFDPVLPGLILAALTILGVRRRLRGSR